MTDGSFMMMRMTKMMSDLIDRQAAIAAFQMFRKYDSNRSNSEWVDRIEAVLRNLPTFDTDISEYSDRLWKLAYERGQKEGVVRCKDCKFASYEPYKDFVNVYICNYSYWTRAQGGRYPDWYCARAERRTDEID